MRTLLWLLFLLAPGLAQGLVLPFEGPQGFSLAQRFALGLKAPPPSLLALLLPNPPWTGGYEATGGLYTKGGALLAREITGADWLLLGREEGGSLRLFLAQKGGVKEGLFQSPETAWLWLKAQGLVSLPTPLPVPTLPEARLRALAQGQDPDPLHQSALDLREGRGPGLLLGVLPEPLLKLWQEILPPAYRALGLLAEGRREEALALLPTLLEGGALEGAAAMILLRQTEDERWKEAARSLAGKAPDLALAWEWVSYAAFEEGKGEEAKEALLRALSLRPDYWLYWTNLGWAYYLVGDLARAELASRRAVRLQPNATAHYNLGLFAAIRGDHLGAFSAYTRALRLDEGEEFKEALKDLEARPEPQALFYRAYLSEKAGLPAEGLYRAFLEAAPRHPLAPMARRALGASRGTELQVLKLTLLPGDREARPFRVGEAILPEVRLEGRPYLLKGELEALLLQGEEEVARGAKPLGFPPLTVALQEVAPALTPLEPGPHTLVLRYGGKEVRLPLEIGPPSLARQVYARGLLPKDLDGRPLLRPEEMLEEKGEELLLQRTQEALREAAPLATGPRLQAPLEQGPYRGETPRALLEKAPLEAIRAFYQAVVEDPSLLGDEDVVNAFLNWLLGLE